MSDVRGVVFVLSDTLRADHLGCYPGGPDGVTPNLDRFAEGATVFEKNYPASYPTIPNRHDVYTGRYQFPYKGWAHFEGDENALPQVLARNGILPYLVFDTPLLNMYNFNDSFGGWQQIRDHVVDKLTTDPTIETELSAEPHKIMGPHTSSLQYLRNRDDWDNEGDFIAPRTFSTAIDWLENNRHQDRFFLSIDTWDPHEAFDAPEHYVDRYEDVDPDTEHIFSPVYGRPDHLSEAEHERVKAHYKGKVSMVDAMMGQLLDAIERFGIEDEVMVVFTSDHGHLFGEHDLQGKPVGGIGRLYEESIRTPLIVRHPEMGRGERVDSLTQHPDIMPTVLDAFGLDVPETVEGRSVLPLLAGDADDREYAITARFPEGAHEASGTDLTVAWAGPEGSVSPATVTGDRWSLICHPNPDESALFDLEADPAQEHDVSDQHPEVVEEMRRVFLDFIEERETTDRLLEPFVSEGERYDRDSLDADRPVYTFEYHDTTFAFLDAEEARARLPSTSGPEDVGERTFGTLADEQPRAMVFIDLMYYWAEDLAVASSPA